MFEWLKMGYVADARLKKKEKITRGFRPALSIVTGKGNRPPAIAQWPEGAITKP